MKYITALSVIMAAAILFPSVTDAQSLNQTRESLQHILDNVHQDMIKECDKLISVATAIGGFGAVFYIGVRVWKHIAAAEPIDFFPLFRPFVLALMIGIFQPLVLGTLNGILSPITMATDVIAKQSNEHVKILIERNDRAVMEGTDNPPINSPGAGDESWRKYDTPEITDPKDSVTSGSGFSFGLNMISNAVTVFIKMLMSKILELLFFAASLCINTIRTFHLIILSILGPLVFAFSIFDGLQHTLAIWIGRYINIYLWLPICNLFSALINKIQANMLDIDYAQQASAGVTMFTQTDMAYMVFLVIAIVGYFSIPSIANFIIHASGESAIMRKVTTLVSTGVSSMSSGVTSMLVGAGSMAADGPGPDVFSSSMADARNSEPYLKDPGNFQRKQLKG